MDGRSEKKTSRERGFYGKSFRVSISGTFALHVFCHTHTLSCPDVLPFYIDSQDLPKTPSEIEIQLTELDQSSSSVSFESLRLHRSRSITTDRDRSGSTNSCKLDIPEEGPAGKEVGSAALRSSASC